MVIVEVRRPVDKVPLAPCLEVAWAQSRVGPFGGERLPEVLNDDPAVPSSGIPVCRFHRPQLVVPSAYLCCGVNMQFRGLDVPPG